MPSGNRRKRELRGRHFFLLRMLLVLILSGIVLGIGCGKKPAVVERVPPEPEMELPEPRPEPELSRAEQWQALVREKRDAPGEEKIAAVNTFFNSFPITEDFFLWGVKDYWATLYETLARGLGDCEDLAFAKYFTLRELSIPDERMRITYVISLKTGKPHMVLTCGLHSRSQPLVLDTVNNDLHPVSGRSDLVPVYSFNGNGYWLARQEEEWQGEYLGGVWKLSLWRDVLERMETEAGISPAGEGEDFLPAHCPGGQPRGSAGKAAGNCKELDGHG